MLKQPNPQNNSNSTNFVQHQWNIIYPSHPRPAHLMMQPANKRTYSDAFNVSKRTGKILWELLTPVLPDSKSKDLLHNIEIALYQWMLTNPIKNELPIDNIPFLNGLQFNEEHTLQKNMNVTVTATRDDKNHIELLMPAINPMKDIIAPPNTESCKLKIMATTYSVADGAKASGCLTELDIPYNNLEIPAESITLPLTAEKGILVIVAMAIEYNILKEHNLYIVHNQERMPAGIIWAGFN